MSTSTPFPMPLLTIYVFELFPQFKLSVSLTIAPGERTRGDGGNHRHPSHRSDWTCRVCSVDLSICVNLNICRLQCVDLSICLNICVDLSICVNMCVNIYLNICVNLNICRLQCVDLNICRLQCVDLSICVNICVNLNICRVQCGFEYFSPGDFKEVAQLKGDLVLLTVACSQPEYASRSHKFVVLVFSPSTNISQHNPSHYIFW